MSCPHLPGAADFKLEHIQDLSSHSNPELFVTRHVDFDWTINFESQTISGSVLLHMSPVDLYIANRAAVQLDVKDLIINRVSVDGKQVEFTTKEGKYPNLGSVLCVDVGHQQSGFKMAIEYSTTPQSSALQWLDTQMTADKKRPFLFTQCQAIHARSLFPCQDTPRVKFTFSASIIAPAGATVLMGAQRPPSPRHCQEPANPMVHYFTQEIPIPSYLVALVCGELASARIGARSLVWAEPSVMPRAQLEFNEVDDMLAAAERICGAYEWGTYDILVLPPSFPFGGMENPCLTFVTPCLLSGDRSLCTTIAHEITHAWTGNLVTNASWEHFWLNEGHTKYIEGLILEQLYGTDYRELFIEIGYEELQLCLAEFKDGHPYSKLVPCLNGVDPDDAFSVVPYQKGSLLLYYLEQKYGKEAILSWLRAYISHFRRHSLSTRTWMDFLAAHLGQRVIQEVKWNDWLYRSGPIPWVPKLNHKLSAIVDQVVLRIANTPLGRDADSAAYVRSQYEMMLPMQQRLLWQRLLKYLPMAHDNLRVLDSMLAVSLSMNSEVRYLWALIVLYSQYLPGVDCALEFLNSQGRMKFTRPIYKAMMAWSAIRQQAINNFKTQRPFMHSTTAKLVEKDIGMCMQ